MPNPRFSPSFVFRQRSATIYAPVKHLHSCRIYPQDLLLVQPKIRNVRSPGDDILWNGLSSQEGLRLAQVCSLDLGKPEVDFREGLCLRKLVLSQA